jgi:hypothetical protein
MTVTLSFLLRNALFCLSLIPPGATALAGLTIAKPNEQLASGDILFQDSNSAQSRAIMAVTHSRFSHCGIYVVKNGHEMVIECAEGSEPVEFHKWINRDRRHYVAMRLKEHPRGLTETQIEALDAVAERYGRKPYDWLFLWRDNKIYCSELVWKAYKAIGVELTPLQHFRDFPIDREPAKGELKKRFGRRPIPRDEPVVSPQALADSEKLFVVKDTTH